MLHLLLLFIFQATAAQCNVRMGQLAKLSLEERSVNVTLHAQIA
jgi:hypothetical protein